MYPNIYFQQKNLWLHRKINNCDIGNIIKLNENIPKFKDKMDLLNENVMVGSLVAKNPAYANLFEKIGIDYCCKGKKTLKELCIEKNLDPRAVLDQLKEISTTPLIVDLNNLSLNDLITHIIKKHHDYLREELPRLSNLIYKVATKHSGLHPELLELRGIFEEFKVDVLNHIEKEETIIFPAIELLATNKKKPTFSKDSLESYLNDLDSEHTEAGAALEKMNKLTNGYILPIGACTTYRVMLNSLSLLEKDMHEHVHKENHILFPHALKKCL
jgi:regulator of cell morphogenesis and NO signaling